MGVLKTLYNVNYSVFFRSEKFYCQIDIGGGVFFKIWERPGRWMEEKQLNQMLEDIRYVALSGQGEKDIPDYGVLKGEKSDLNNRVITISYDKKSGKPVGFAAQIFLDVTLGINIVEVLHMGLVFVTKDYQKKSMLGLLYILPNILLLLKRGFRPLWVSNVSQIPAIIGVVADYYDKVYPNPIHPTYQTLMHKSLGVGIMKDYRSAFGTGDDATYYAEKQIIANSYTGGSNNLKKTFEESPKYRSEIVNIFCRENLDYHRGDDIIQLGVLSGKLIHNFLSKKVSGVSRLQWFAYLLIASIFITLLPVLRWLTRKMD